MARQVRRNAARSAVAHKRIKCPECKKPLFNNSEVGNKVVCAACGWKGRIK
jgi:uncharacterized Zn finger protein (UPF0148 family)